MFNRPLWQEAQKSRLTLWLTVLFSVLGSGAVILQAYWLSRIVNGVFLEGLALTAVSPWLWLLLLAVALRALLSAGREVAANRLAAHVKADLRQRLFAAVQARGPVAAAGEQTGEITAVLTNGVDALEAYFSQYLPQLFVAVLIPLAVLTAVFPQDWLSALVLLLTAPLMPLFMVLIGRYAQTLTQRQWGLLSRMSAHFLDVLQGLTTLKLLGQSKNQAQAIAQMTDRFRQTTLGVLRVAFLSALALELLATLSVAIIAVAIGLRLLNGGIPLANALFVLILAPEFYQPLRMLGQRFHAGMDGTAAAKRIFKLLVVSDERLARNAWYPEVREAGVAEKGIPKSQIPNPNSPPRVHFANISAVYPNGRSALRGVTFTIEPGETAVLIGPSGAGKSTVANLLLGFLPPTRGELKIAECGVRSAECGPQIAWVPQRPFLFHDTIANNIRLGKPDASNAEVIAAAQQARLHDFISSLPEGYETVIGERGARLSGGQAQRLALARAFLLNAPLVILDEPTAHLDAQTEAELLAATGALLRGRTALIIAHRPQTMRLADKVIVLENGRVARIETGKPELGVGDQRLETGDWRLESENWRPETGGSAPGSADSYSPTTHPVQPASHSPLPAAKSQIPNPKSQIPNPKSQIPNPKSEIFRLLAFLRPYTPWVALSVLLGALTIGSSIGLLGASAYLISAAALQPSIADLGVTIVSVRFFGLSRGVLRYLERLVSHNVTFRLLARLRVWFYQAIEPLAPARLQTMRSGDLLSRIVSDVETLQDFYVRIVGPSLTALLITLVATLAYGRVAPQLGLALCTGLLLAGLGLPLLVYRSSRSLGAELVAARSRLHTLLVDGIQGMADLHAFAQVSRMVEKVAQETAVLAQIQRRLAWRHGLQAGSGDLLAHGSMTAVLWLAIPLVASGQLNGVYLAGLALMTLAVFEAVQPLPLAAQHLESSLAAARRLFDLAEGGEGLVNGQLSMANGQWLIDDGETPPFLTIRNLTFSYPTPHSALPTPHSLPVLRNFSLDLPPGKKVALVGPSGAGKTTLLNLLLRFWEYEEGSIQLNGLELRDLDAESVRRQFSVIAQDTYLFNGSIWENLRLARPEATKAEVETAVRAAGLAEFIAALPEGYETQVGEQGMQLSGGERQRLAIARALLHDAPILLLDEPTAHLDKETEERVLETIWQAAGERSILLITHSQAGLERVDEIVRLA